MTQAKIAALVFDAYGTIFDVHSVVASCEELFPGHGRALSQAWRTKQLEYTWLRNSMGKHVDFDIVTRDALQVACAALSLTYSEAALATLNAAYRTLTLFADARAALQELHGKFPLAILSNGAPHMLNAVVRHSALHETFQAVLSVEEVGVFKPDPRVYQLAVARLGIPRETIGFVSSNGWDAAGAKAFGFRTFWINRASAPQERFDAPPDYMLKSLAELPALLA